MSSRAIFSLLVLLVGLAVMFGCNNSGSPEFSDTPGTQQHQAVTGAPEWYYNPPHEPGVAFYGVGVCDNVLNEGLAKDTADSRARADLAATLKTTIEAVVKDYMRSIFAGSDPNDVPEEEQFVQRTSLAIIESVDVYGAEVWKRDKGYQKPNGVWPSYSLARIGFEAVAESLYEETKESVGRVQHNAEVAFDELRDLLRERSGDDD